jgi:hypothetical protein
MSRPSLDLSNPRKIITIGASTHRHAPVKPPARKLHVQPPHRSQNPLLRASNRVVDLTIGFLLSRSSQSRRNHLYQRSHAPVAALATFLRAQRVLAHAEHTPMRARHTPGTRPARHVNRPEPDPIRSDANQIRAGPDLI